MIIVNKLCVGHFLRFNLFRLHSTRLFIVEYIFGNFYYKNTFDHMKKEFNGINVIGYSLKTCQSEELESKHGKTTNVLKLCQYCVKMSI